MKAIDPAEMLRELGRSGEGPCDIARAALMLAALDRSGRELAPYEEHIMEIAETGQA
jgi:hypothetical protein